MADKLLTRRWVLTTLLVVAAAAVMVRLGFWQLDRLAQRRAFNARVEAQLNAPPLDLNQTKAIADLTGMEYRHVMVTGTFDFDQQVALRNQAWNNQIGVHLLTPLIIEGTNQAVLVDRGWIPLADAGSPQAWRKYDQPGTVTISGMLRAPQTRPFFGGAVDPTLAPGQKGLEEWNVVNVARIAQQVSEPLLPMYIQEAPAPGQTNPPFSALPSLDLTAGPHLSYAIQWFTFAAILLLGYPFFVRWQLRKKLTEHSDGHPTDESVVKLTAGMEKIRVEEQVKKDRHEYLN